MYKVSKLLSIAILSLFSGIGVSQNNDALNADLLKDLDSLLNATGSMSSSSNPALDGEFGSITKNNYSNIVSQMSAVDSAMEDEQLLDALKESRLDLASKLCKKDQRACFLIDEYHKFSIEDFQTINTSDILFGTDLFSGFPLSSSLLEEVPLGDEYIIKAGDALEVVVLNENSKFEVIAVKSDGYINIPQLGSVMVAGLSVREAKNKLQAALSTKALGSEILLSLNQVRANRIFALGAVKFPNAYTVNSQGSLINLIIAAGGFQPNASLRSVQVISKGSAPKLIDLYGLLVKGDGKEDYSLASGDTILISGASNIIKIDGEVNRPGRYEFKEGERLSDLMEFAQDFTVFADTGSITLRRTNELGQYSTINLDNLNIELMKGDIFEVRKSQGEVIDDITLVGALRSPGSRAFAPQMTLGSLIKIESDLLENTYTAFAILERKDRVTRSSTLIGFDLINQIKLDAFSLQPSDKVYIFTFDDIEFLGSSLLQMHLKSNLFLGLAKQDQESSFQPLYKSPVSSKLSNAGVASSMAVDDIQCLTSVSSYGGSQNHRNFQLKARIFQSSNANICPDILSAHPFLTPALLNSSIPIYGNVRNPGLYPVSQDIIPEVAINLAGGSVSNNAQLDYEYFLRGLSTPLSSKNINTDIKNLTALNVIAENTQDEISYVTLVGEIAFPGQYPISSSTTIMDVYERAGGLLPSAYPQGAILSRVSALDREKAALERSRRELASILSNAAATGIVNQSSNDILGLYQLMSTVGEAKPTGRIIAELDPRMISSSPELNIVLEAGDTIYLPKRASSVSIVGAVLNPVTAPYAPSSQVEDYIKIAGGYQSTADKDLVYFILPNGRSVVPSHGFFFSKSSDILPGSTIIVPRKARPLQGFALVEVLTPILANLSITAASISAISNN